MTSETSSIEKLLTDELAQKIVTLVLVGPEPGAKRLLRGWTAAAGERGHTLASSRAHDGWPELPLIDPTELGFEAVVRSLLRQDPDYIIIEAGRGEIPWAMLVQAAHTGHGVLVRATETTDASQVLDGLRALPGDLGATGPSAFPRVVVGDSNGIERVVSAVDDTVVWKRGEALPSSEALTGRTPPPPPPAPEPLAPFEPALAARLRQALEPRLRTTFVPVLAEPSGDSACSKLSGLPVLGPGEPWPRCGECEAPLPLALQLAQDEVPDEARARFPAGAGWLQLFYCAGSTCGASNASDPDCKNKLLRFLADKGAVPARGVPAFEWRLEPRDIVGWKSTREAPDREDNPELGETLGEAQRDLVYRLDCVGRKNAPDPALPDTPEVLQPLAGPLRGDKLLGWPAWTQGAEWETCPRCDERLAFLFQLDASSGALEMLFAESGTGHVSQCPAHRDVLAFRWSCT